jgi:hypothetical protein
MNPILGLHIHCAVQFQLAAQALTLIGKGIAADVCIPKRNGKSAVAAVSLG